MRTRPGPGRRCSRSRGASSARSTWSSGCSSACSPAATCCSKACPGLAKTLTVRTLAETIDTTFQRIQFTPDLLPADVVGTQIFDQRRGQFTREEGPDLRQHRPGRRDQPRAGQGAGGAARGDAGEAGDDRRHDVQARGAVPRAGDAEPDRAGGHVSAARGAGRPLHAQAARRLSDARRGEGDHAAHGGRRADRGPARRDAGRRSWRRARRIAELYMDERIVDYIVDIVHATREPAEAG